MLCSLLAQLASKLTEIPEEIYALWKRYKNKKTRPSPDELLKTLTLVIQKYFNKVYVALDALDECLERQVLLPILNQFIDSQCASIFLTSRSEDAIKNLLSEKRIYSAVIESSDVALDVELFVSRQIKDIESLRDLNVDLQNEILQTLVDGAKGMQVYTFWPFCYIINIYAGSDGLFANWML
jgi:RNAse (barnase) inhibitor barstar